MGTLPNSDMQKPVVITATCGRYFGSEAQGWLNLQAAYDLRIAEKQSAKAIFKEIAPLALAC